MNCRDIEPLLLVERDGMLTPEQHVSLAAHVATCPACQQLRTTYGEAVTFLKTDAANVPVPDVAKEWRTLRAQLHGETSKPAKKRPLAPVIWFSAPLAAAAAALAIGFFVFRPAVPVPTEDATVSTIAYVDQESGWLVVWAADPGAKKSG